MGKDYPEDWNRRRRAVYRRDDHMCQNCGTKGGPRGNAELHAHHIVPKSKGGTHKKRNLVTVCKACHYAIHGRGTAPTPIDCGDLSEVIQEAIERHYRTDEHEDGYVRLGDSTTNTHQRTADRKRNEEYDGCPNCDCSSLTVSWVGLGPGSKVKVVECTSCGAQYDEQIENVQGRMQRVLYEVADPSEISPTRSAFFKELTDSIRLWLDL
jgi:5-methylcytosine-specific restriction endonuclease McrA